MVMKSEKIEALIRKAFPDATVELQDLAGDGDHYRIRVVSTRFAGLSRVAQHQLVYQALEGRMGGELHALAVSTSIPANTNPGESP